MPRILVIADDFTGANDTAVQFSKQGFETMVTTELTQINKNNADVIVVDTETRHMEKQPAYECLKQVAVACKQVGAGYIYKKIDSTLRGNIGSEVEALMDVMAVPTAVLIPAMPSTGRQTIGGYQMVRGIPLQKTDIAKDPLNPVEESYIPKLLASQMKRPVVLISLYHVLLGKEELVKALKQAARGEGEVIVIDAATGEDLEVIADALREANLLSFTVGPADFAGYLGRLALSGPVKTKTGSVLTVVGSVNEVSLRQVEFLAKYDKFMIINLQVERLFRSAGFEEEKAHLCAMVDNALRQEKDVVLCTARSKADVKNTLDQGEKFGLNSKEVADQISRQAGQLTAFLIRHFGLPAAVLTGGDIAIATYRALELQGVKIIEEVLPGIPYGTVDQGVNRGLKLITKAGAFGEKDALINCIKFLKG